MKAQKSFFKGAVISILFIAIGATAIISVSNKNNVIENLHAEKSQISTTLEERDSLVNEMASTFNEIEENLSFVREKRSQLKIEQQEGNYDKNEMIVADIKLMNEMLTESSKKIEELNAKLKSSGIEINAFKKRIEKLNENIIAQNVSIDNFTKELSEKNKKIAEMSIELTEIESQVANLENDVEIKNDSLERTKEIVARQDMDLNKTYLASGTFEELVENGVLEKEGGLLGIGKSITLSENINQEYFKEIDKRTLRLVPIFAKKAKIITEHPDSSFRFIEEDNMISYVEIENPDEFWKFTKYAVIETKK